MEELNSDHWQEVSAEEELRERKRQYPSVKRTAEVEMAKIIALIDSLATEPEKVHPRRSSEPCGEEYFEGLPPYPKP